MLENSPKDTPGQDLRWDEPASGQTSIHHVDLAGENLPAVDTVSSIRLDKPAPNTYKTSPLSRPESDHLPARVAGAMLPTHCHSVSRARFATAEQKF